MVKPIMYFALDIWGFEYSHAIEKIHINFCKRISCQNQNTADFLALSECVRYPLAVGYISQSIKFWLRSRRFVRRYLDNA